MHLTLTTSNQQDQQLSILIRLLTRSLLHTCPSYLCIWRHRQTHTYTKSNLVRHQSFSCVCSRVLACLSCDKKRENKQIPQGGKVQGSSQPYPHSISLVWFVVGPCLISRHRSCLPKWPLSCGQSWGASRRHTRVVKHPGEPRVCAYQQARNASLGRPAKKREKGFEQSCMSSCCLLHLSSSQLTPHMCDEQQAISETKVASQSMCVVHYSDFDQILFVCLPDIQMDNAAAAELAGTFQPAYYCVHAVARKMAFAMQSVPIQFISVRPCVAS